MSPREGFGSVSGSGGSPSHREKKISLHIESSTLVMFMNLCAEDRRVGTRDTGPPTVGAAALDRVRRSHS